MNGVTALRHAPIHVLIAELAKCQHGVVTLEQLHAAWG